MTILDFWFDFASTYSYVAAMRVEDVARQKGVAVRWRPFLLGPIFAKQGWTSSPFNLYPVKGRNMVRDLERICAKAGLPFRLPDPFPQNSLHAARIAWAIDEAHRAVFSRAVFAREFGEGLPIDDREALGEILIQQEQDAPAILERATSENNKAWLKDETRKAERIGVYGAPTFVTLQGEVFWGNDRLEDALDWALSETMQ